MDDLYQNDLVDDSAADEEGLDGELSPGGEPDISTEDVAEKEDDDDEAVEE